MADADAAGIQASYEAMLDGMNRDDYDDCLTYYTKDAMHIPQGGDVITGHAEIKEYFKKTIPPLKDFVPGDIIYYDRINETTVYRLNYVHCVDKNGKKRTTLNDGILWRKVNGKWLLDRDMYNDCGGPIISCEQKT